MRIYIFLEIGLQLLVAILYNVTYNRLDDPNSAVIKSASEDFGLPTFEDLNSGSLLIPYCWVHEVCYRHCNTEFARTSRDRQCTCSGRATIVVVDKQ